MILQNIPYRLQFYFQLTLAYSCHYLKEGKAKGIFLLRMKQRFMKSFSSYDIFNECIKNLCITVCIIRTISK